MATDHHIITDTTDYTDCKNDLYKVINENLHSPTRFQTIKERKENSVFDCDLIQKVSKGEFKSILFINKF